MIPIHLQPIMKKVRLALCGEPPVPWREVPVEQVGGVVAVGFDRRCETLLVVSHSGRGLFDVRSGERIARDREDDGYDHIGLTARGIGRLEDETFRMAGLHGGGLPEFTADGWHAERLMLDWPSETLLLTPPGSSLYHEHTGRPHDFHKIADQEFEVRAWGFSWDGKALLLAVTDQIRLYARD